MVAVLSSFNNPESLPIKVFRQDLVCGKNLYRVGLNYTSTQLLERLRSVQVRATQAL
jgi:hypothetical protein